tara:strand:+ start:314 stop:853 length:540 start_codon:yes stop_codon:yes gene_type:complete
MEYGQMMEQAKENAKLAFYQNPGYQLERRERKSFIIKVLGTEGIQTSPFQFSLNLHEPLRVDRLSDIYLENFTTYHHGDYNTAEVNKSAFVLKINEFNHQGNSTDSNTFNKLIIPNEHAGSTGATSRKIHKGKKLNYIASINPITLTNITGTITDLNGDAMFDDNLDMFLAEFVIIARD